MNFKSMILSNWKLVFLLVQLGILAALLVSGKALADPIDNPWGPK